MINIPLQIEFKGTPLPMLVFSRKDLQITAVNEAACLLYGYSESEFLKLSIEDIRPADQVSELHKQLRVAPDQANDIQIARHQKKDGSPLDVRVVSTPLENGDKEYRLVIIQDLTEYEKVKQVSRHNYELLETFAEHLPGTFFVYDEELKLQRWNENVMKLSGYTEEEVQKLKPEEFFREEDKEDLYAAIGEAFEQGETKIKLPLKTKDGDLIPLLFSASVVQVSGNQFLVGIGTDLSGQEQIRLELEQQRKLLEAITEQSGSIIFVKDVGGKYRLVNKKFREDLGLGDKQVIGKTDRDIFSKELADFLLEDDRKVLKSGKPHRYEDTVPTAEGETTYITVKYPLKDIPGYEQSICGIATDISLLKETEGRLEELYEREKSERRQLEILTQISSIFMEEQAGVTAALRKTADYLTGEVVHLCSFDIIDIDSDKPERLITRHRDSDKEKLARKLNQNSPQLFYGSEVLKSALEQGNGLWIKINEELLNSEVQDEALKKLVKELELGWIFLRPLISDKRNVGLMTLAMNEKQKEALTGTGPVLDEVAHRIALAVDNLQVKSRLRRINKELDARVDERTRELEKANKELESFSYSVSHDLRAPLRAIDGYSALLKEDYYQHLDEDGKEFLEIINDEARRMGELIDDLLAFSRMTRKEKSSEQFSMHDLVVECTEELRGVYEQKSPEIEIRDLPEVRADRPLMRQVWLNLIGNSMKYTGKDEEPRISIYCNEDKEQNMWQFSINDQGVGFDMKYADKLFGVFQRLHSEDEFEGTGIGLALVKKIVSRHGGDIAADSEINKGTTITFTLPK